MEEIKHYATFKIISLQSAGSWPVVGWELNCEIEVLDSTRYPIAKAYLKTNYPVVCEGGIVSLKETLKKIVNNEIIIERAENAHILFTEYFDDQHKIIWSKMDYIGHVFRNREDVDEAVKDFQKELHIKYIATV